MELLLERFKMIPEQRTLGRLMIGSREWYTCEDAIRATKVYGKTAIAAGRYQIIISYSNRFKQRMPLLLNVPNFVGIRIHPGNTEKHTEGCILVGKELLPNFAGIGASKQAYKEIFDLLSIADRKEANYITIVDKF